jgi:DNA repair ATPase RecN
MVVEKMSIQVLLEQTKTKLKEQVKNIDILELMLLQVLDHADFLIGDYIKWCREKAEELSQGKIDASRIYTRCIYVTVKDIEKELRDYVKEVYNSADTLFAIYYNYWLPEELTKKYYEKAEGIILETIKTYLEKAFST